MEGTFEDEFGRAPARVENVSFLFSVTYNNYITYKLHKSLARASIIDEDLSLCVPFEYSAFLLADGYFFQNSFLAL